MSIYESTAPAFKKTLTYLEKWLNAGAAYAESKKFDPNVLLSARLAPDQYPLVRQVQSSCDTAKFTAARLTGREAPKHPDTETTLDELYTRIHAVYEYLDSFKEADFSGAETRRIELQFFGGKHMLGADYVREMQIPNFFFHVTHTYAILRHNGVPLGKTDFIGGLTLRD